MLFRQIYNDQLAQASYLIACQASGEALIVDPTRDIEAYLGLAEREGVRITAVTETHIHADFISGARELAARTKAKLYLSGEGGPDWSYAFAEASEATLLRHNDSFRIGKIEIKAIHTPGHTPEHLIFVVTDSANTDLPIGICSGDLLFVGDVGRPDLLEKAAGVLGSTDKAARKLFHSLQALRTLPGFVQIWPGHGAGSACGRALGGVPQSTLGYEREVNWAFTIEDEENFMSEVLRGQPTPPPYFATMKEQNKRGPQLLSELPVIQSGTTETLAQALAAGERIIDLRPADQFRAGHIAGSINLPATSGFLNWAGWFTDAKQPIGLIGDSAQLGQAVQLLRQIGSDQIRQTWSLDLLAEWPETLATIADYQPTAAQIPHGFALLDVRNRDEYAQEHIAGSLNIPLNELATRVAELPKQPVLVQCASGTRSAIASSLLSAAKIAEVHNFQGGIQAWKRAGFPTQSAG
jgi:hydroxyacylglutathione hydrolase